MTRSEDPRPPPTLMSARTLLIYWDKGIRRYLIGADRYEFVAAGDFEEWRERRNKRRFWQNPMRVVGIRITVRTPRGEAFCVLDRRDEEPGFSFRSGDEAVIGAYRDSWIFDRHDRPIAQYISSSWWQRQGHIISGNDEDVATIKVFEETTIDFTAPTSTEFRLLIICTGLALHYEYDLAPLR
jgi:hypothetical protein